MRLSRSPRCLERSSQPPAAEADAASAVALATKPLDWAAAPTGVGFGDGHDVVAAASGEVDPALRLRKLAEVERWLFTEEVPMLPICNYVTVYMYDPVRTGGMTDHPRLEQDLSILGPRRGDAPPAKEPAP